MAVANTSIPESLTKLDAREAAILVRLAKAIDALSAAVAKAESTARRYPRHAPVDIPAHGWPVNPRTSASWLRGTGSLPSSGRK
jgi:hypothetical protein